MKSLINYSLDSEDELHFYYWLEELYNKNIITNVVSERTPIQISDKVSYIETSTKTLKNKIVNTNKEIVLIKEKYYTPDFIITFNPKYDHINLTIDNNLTQTTRQPLFIRLNSNKPNTYYIDIKGGYSDHYNSSITFADRQAMCIKRGYYINKVICQITATKATTKAINNCLFASTFTPQKVVELMQYKIKSKLGQTKIKHVIKTSDQWITSVQA